MNSKINITASAYAYFVFVGISYMWGYWLPFGLNILEFADISDIVKASAYPLLPAAGLLLALAALDGINAISKKQYDEHINEGGLSRAYMRFLTIFNYLFIVAAIGHSGYQIIVESGYDKLKGVFPLAAILVFYHVLYGNKYLLWLDLRVRTFIIALLCFLPSAAFNTGNTAGAKIKNLEGSYWTIVTQEKCANPKDELVLLGRVSNKYLAMVKSDKSLCIIQDGSIQLVQAGRTKT